MGRRDGGQKAAEESGQVMQPESIGGKPERKQPIPFNEKSGPSPITKQPIQQPASTEELMTQANRAVAQYTKQAASVRHPLGKGIPASHEVFE